MTQPSTLQNFPLEAGIQAIKDSVHFTDFEAFYSHLWRVCRRIRLGRANATRHWSCGGCSQTGSSGGILPRAWQTYRDDQLLLELARVTVLEVEPVIAPLRD